MKLFDKILVANRGEIAVRIIRLAQKLGIRTIAIFSDADEKALHTEMADEAYHIGSDNLSESYLNIEKIIRVAQKANCKAIHPGYGFLSENPAFVAACENAGIVFIGPKSRVVKEMGNKIAARAIAKKCGTRITEGLTGLPNEIIQQSNKLTFPVLIKAAAGGGGKGMRIVENAGDLPLAIESTSREALNYFGDSTVYAEHYFKKPRHIEIQILGDNYGNIIHLFERECSIQRRYQKIIEESPSPTLNPEVRQEMCRAAVNIAKSIEYNNAGTIEFLVDESLNFYFLEMNTRIQVEHPVTEMVTGIDIVEEQIRIASGFPLGFKQEDIKQKGHAIECRIYAENPAKHFMPSPGEITLYHQPAGEGVRLDSALNKKAIIHSFFDPMISKLICWAPDREIARHKAIEMLDHYIILGIETNISFLSEMLKCNEFSGNAIYTTWCDVISGELVTVVENRKKNFPKHIPALAFLLFDLNKNRYLKIGLNVWETIGFWRNLIQLPVLLEDEKCLFELVRSERCNYEFLHQTRLYRTKILSLTEDYIKFSIDDVVYQAYISKCLNRNAVLTINGLSFKINRPDVLCDGMQIDSAEVADTTDSNAVISPMYGKVIKVNVNEGDEVKKGNILAVIEAMKMENNIVAVKDARILKSYITIDQMVESNKVLFTLE